MTLRSSWVFVVDDDPQMREALQRLLRSVGHDVMMFDSTEAFLASEQTDAPGCLILDVRLPGASGLQLQRDLLDHGCKIPIIFITGHGDVPMSVAAMKAGAIEFLLKPFRTQDLLDAVHRGITADRSSREEATRLESLRDRFATLSRREQEVMALVTAGKLNKQIADALSLSEVTVKVHRANVMRKMQASSLPELVRMADRLR
jgi:FixJ family two-component response regulator